jgi:plastocyanin
MAKKAYVRNSQNTEWVEIASATTDLSAYLTNNSASSTYATKSELNSIDLISTINTASAAAVTYLVDSAPATLDTLNELASALGDDANFASTVATSIGNKLDISSASTIYATKTELENVPTTFNGTTDATLAGISINEIAYSAITRLEVTSSGTSAYLMNNQYSGNNPTVYAIAGTTIAFNLNVTGHPFLIKTAGGAADYSTGLIHVATDGTVTTGSSAQGKTSGTLYWQIPSDITGAYAYQCSVHAGMLGVITITSQTFTSFNSLSAPTIRLSSTIDASDNINNHGFQVGANNSENIRIDNNEILALNNDVNSVLNIQRHGGQVLVGGSVVDGSSVGLEVHGPLRLESSRNAANNTRGIDSMQAKIAINSTNNRQELQIYASGDSYSTGSKGAGIHLYGTDDSQHAGNIAFLTGTPDNGDARIIVSGGTGTTGYVSGGTTYTRTNTDTRVTIGNGLWDWVDTKLDTGLLNLKDASNRPSIYVESAGSTDGSTYGTIGIETGRDFGIGHWSGSAYTNRLSISSAGIVSIPGILDVAEVRETVVSNSFSTNVMTANYNDGAIHYATVAPTANFTISLTNVPTTTSKSITMSFLITQGSTGYIPTTLNLNGSSQTIRWVGGSAPTPTSSAGKIDIFNFTLILAASNVLIASANLNI